MGDVTLQPLLLLVSIMWNLCDLIFFHVFPFTLLSISLGAPTRKYYYTEFKGIPRNLT